MKWLIEILKGFAIGLANVVAGLSGGTVAVLLNAYEDLLDFFSSIATHLFAALKKHYKLIIGIILGLLIGAALLGKLYDVAPLPVTGFFAGLVFISLFPLSKGLSLKAEKKNNILNIVLLIVSACLLIALAFATAGSSKTLELNTANAFIVIALGIVSAIAMILPGVSGSMILLVLGYYGSVTGMVRNLSHFNSENYFSNIVMLILFAIGVLIGLVCGSKCVKKLLAKYKLTMNFIIYGLIVGSLVGMIVTAVNKNTDLLIAKSYPIGGKEDIIMHTCAILLFVLGIISCLCIERYINSKKVTKKEEKSLKGEFKEE